MERSLMSNNIKPEQIDNIDEVENLLKHILCSVCLEIPISAMECYSCGARLCEDCWEILKMADKKCVTPKCTGNIKKANKYMREVISRLIVSCTYCSQKSIQFKFYQKHLDESCKVYPLVEQKKITFLKTIKEKNAEIDKLQEQLNQLKLSTTMEIINRSPKKDKRLSSEQIKNTLLSFNLPVNKKMELYNSAINGDLVTFKKLILNLKYPLFEEVSAASYNWTAFHYAMHYGQYEIVCFIFEYLKSKSLLDMALQVTSSDGRCPLLCLLRSNSIDLDTKKTVFIKLLQKYKFHISNKVKRELGAREIEYVLDNGV